MAKVEDYPIEATQVDGDDLFDLSKLLPTTVYDSQKLKFSTIRKSLSGRLGGFVFSTDVGVPSMGEFRLSTNVLTISKTTEGEFDYESTLELLSVGDLLHFQRKSNGEGVSYRISSKPTPLGAPVVGYAMNITEIVSTPTHTGFVADEPYEVFSEQKKIETTGGIKYVTTTGDAGIGEMRINGSSLSISGFSINRFNISSYLTYASRGDIITLVRKSDGGGRVYMVTGDASQGLGSLPSTNLPVAITGQTSGFSLAGDDEFFLEYVPVDLDAWLARQFPDVSSGAVNIANGWNGTATLTGALTLTFSSGYTGANGIIKLVNVNGNTLDIAGTGLTIKRNNAGVLEANASITLQSGATTEQILTYTYTSDTELIFEIK